MVEFALHVLSRPVCPAVWSTCDAEVEEHLGMVARLEVLDGWKAATDRIYPKSPGWLTKFCVSNDGCSVSLFTPWHPHCTALERMAYAAASWPRRMAERAGCSCLRPIPRGASILSFFVPFSFFYEAASSLDGPDCDELEAAPTVWHALTTRLLLLYVLAMDDELRTVDFSRRGAIIPRSISYDKVARACRLYTINASTVGIWLHIRYTKMNSGCLVETVQCDVCCDYLRRKLYNKDAVST